MPPVSALVAPLTSASTHSIPDRRPDHGHRPLAHRDEELVLSTARAEAIRLANRITTLDAELKDNHSRTTDLLGASPAASPLKRDRDRGRDRRRRLYSMVPSGPGTFLRNVRRSRQGSIPSQLHRGTPSGTG
jgi:hypothetical protein